ncbi:uncharacterized protein BJ171DRAFT_528938 [Polychytrium aggregatum]|uniref:uncharacterized protein n=1 Tax=Polychytrium aggregatum TaxID=110093 RepID=UPI0022FEDA4C|nr:uncharacterized protein BJ171DRAFT_528938 [Polychytrium aggregatum]KAI9193340.1 hypothetical protein BJ171DRAFT_528938 [Polychytrium aggregatum]
MSPQAADPKRRPANDSDDDRDPQQKRLKSRRGDSANSDLGSADLHDGANRQDDDDDNDNDDVGPMPVSSSEPKKRHKVLEHEQLFLENLPCKDMYEKSLMHRDIVNFVEVSSQTDFIITTSIDGHVKFWKKTEKGIEFVKHYRAHLSAIVAVALSHDGLLFATAGADKALKIFDVVNFDMINLIKLDYLPNSLSWACQKGQIQALLLCSDKESPAIHVYDGRGGDQTICTVSKIHQQPVHIMQYHPDANTIVSVDEGGMIEYWVVSTTEPLPPPPEAPYVSWEYKAETDLYEFKKAKVVPSSLRFSPDFSMFVTFGFGDRAIRIFNFKTGKLIRKYDESLSVITEMKQAGTLGDQLDDMEFGRRLAIEREFGQGKSGQVSTANVIFDESGNFILYPTLLGIKIVNIVTNKVVRLISKMDNQRFLNIALYQGAPKKKNLMTSAMAASDNQLLKDSLANDPTLFCTAYKRNRFYLLTRREHEETGSATGRDIFNEKPSREEQTVAAMSSTNLKAAIGSAAIIHTSFGDIHLQLFPQYAPKAVENFVGLAKKGFYSNLIFHRVIKGFMIQTGCPFGDGTGSESLWGHEFEDEFHKAAKHDRPYTLSMANSGPGTNGSQFFITTVPTPWLDNKHTVFGRATGGMDVVQKIEGLKVDKFDKPYEDVRILSIEVR